jgi:transposase
MRRGFDRLVQTARERGGHDPTEGGILVVFSNRRATRLKLLWVERNGVCILYSDCTERNSSCRWPVRARSRYTSTALSWRSCSLV